MLPLLRQLFRARPTRPAPALPQGQRVYAIGDIHGQLDLFLPLIDAIEEDDADSAPAETTVILLGDLIDRGPDSAGVIAAARAWQARRRVRCIAGNHEEMFLAAFEKEDVLRHLLRYGGRETLLSYPITVEEYTAATIPETQALMRRAVPEDDIAFLRAMEDMIAIGDYLFVHAGIQPGTPLDTQKTHDLRWIREPFLSAKDDHGAVVVHGHTIAPDPVLQPNRIGIDTGGYMHGVLTALRLEGTSQALVQARAVDGAVAVARRDICS